MMLLILLLLFVYNVYVNCDQFCAAGSYCVSSPSSGKCFPCSIGHFKRFDSTVPCGPNLSITDTSICEPCSPGTYQCMSNSTECMLCAAGKYQPESASSTMCLECPRDHYSIKGSNTCSQCSPGFVSKPNSPECIPAVNGLLNFLLFILLFLVAVVLYISYNIICRRQYLDKTYVSLQTGDQLDKDVEMTSNAN